MCARLRHVRDAVQKYEPPSGDLAEQIEKDFGSLDKLVADFNPKTVAIQVHFLLPHDIVCPRRRRAPQR